MSFLAQSELVPRIPLGDWIEAFVDWVTATFDALFDVLEALLAFLIGTFDAALSAPPSFLMLVLLSGIAWYLASWRVALFSALGFLLIMSMGLWGAAMLTLALVVSSAIVALVIGIPVGILAAQSKTMETITRPVLDLMQTMPAFVYLIPAILLLGLGGPPALIATVIFAMPPAVRLTLLGIQQVSKETVEAAHAFGATPWQTLLKVELPQAFPTIMAGVNQVIMLALSMVVIASLIGAEGLGNTVLQGLSRLDVGLGFEGGIGIVILAIYLDRITRNVGRRRGAGSGGGKS
jgi:glycine betaine/proline transport system permease protein